MSNDENDNDDDVSQIHVGSLDNAPVENFDQILADTGICLNDSDLSKEQ